MEMGQGAPCMEHLSYRTIRKHNKPAGGPIGSGLSAFQCIVFLVVNLNEFLLTDWICWLEGISISSISTRWSQHRTTKKRGTPHRR